MVLHNHRTTIFDATGLIHQKKIQPVVLRLSFMLWSSRSKIAVVDSKEQPDTDQRIGCLSPAKLRHWLTRLEGHPQAQEAKRHETKERPVGDRAA